MALTFLPSGGANDPTYMFLSTDIVNNKVSGVVIPGAKCLATDTQTWYIVNSDFTLSIYFTPNKITVPYQTLTTGDKSVIFTLASGSGSVPIPDTARRIGVYEVSSGSMRIGLEAPAAITTGSATAGSAVLSNGVFVQPQTWTWFDIGLLSTGRTLYIRSSGASDVLNIVVM